MALFLRQTEQRTKLQEKIAADLRNKASLTTLVDDGTSPTDPEKLTYLDGTKKTTTLAWVWMLIFMLAIITFIIYATH
jgi:hypothetical protein